MSALSDLSLGVTAREQEVLSLLSRGMTNCEIARALWISPGTVRKHLENVYPKLGVNNRAGAVARFLSQPSLRGGPDLAGDWAEAVRL